MKYKLYIPIIVLLCTSYTQAPSIKLTDVMLMHEMRETPSPLNRAVVSEKNVSFMWPLKTNTRIHSGLEGMEEESKIIKPNPSALNYRIRFSKDINLKKDVTTAELSWPFYNPEKPLSAGQWYWQYGYVKDGKTEWSEKLEFAVKENPKKFSPPPYTELIAKLPQGHPRILIFENEWDGFIQNNINSQERKWYIERADQAMDAPIVHLPHAIDTSKIGDLNNKVKKNALLTRESRRIVDREEANIDALIRAYVVTKNRPYCEAAMKRVEEMITWKHTPYFVGDFNSATLLSICSMAYDAFFHELPDEQKVLLLKEIKDNGAGIFNGFANHLENHIADNHNWQMNLRIFTMAAFAVYGELPEAEQWTNYSYNLWLARFPGLNTDGGWHNGDSYFHVNLRTLIEVPYFFSRITGYNYHSDPWYEGSAMYVIYQQPPFSKSGGNGSSHQNVVTPSGTRVAYADALARLTHNAYAADYVYTIAMADPDILKKGFMSKPGDLSWFRLQCHTPLPERKELKELPLSYVFPQTGLASFMSDWGNIKHNAMFSFRSSPYGSTSHALANQNAFNTFYGGKPLFYSSGHHISFTDEHSVYCHRATRAHNTILVNGMGQRIGTEGYGWIPRYYCGEKISYVVGDASNAYGEVISSLWLKRGQQSKLEYSSENGWSKNHLKMFRRHLVQLKGADLVFIYDELEADIAVTWDYLLHTVENPMVVSQLKDAIHVKASNAEGISEAYLFSNSKLETKETDQFFYPAVNWLRADNEGHFAPYRNHWHFTASTPQKAVNRFATIISTHHKDQSGIVPQLRSHNLIEAGDWVIRVNLSDNGKATFTVENTKEQIRLVYDGVTVIQEKEKRIVLTDEIPELEI